MRRSLLLGLGLGLLLPSAVYAQAIEDEAESPTDYSRSGFYIGVGGTLAKELFGGFAKGGYDLAVGANVRLGYRVNPWVAIETTYEWAGNFEPDAPLARKIQVYYVAPGARLFLLHGRVQPSIIIGLGWLEGKVRNDNLVRGEFGARVGVGIDTYLTENIVFALDTSYLAASGRSNPFDYLSFQWGLAYRF